MPLGWALYCWDHPYKFFPPQDESMSMTNTRLTDLINQRVDQLKQSLPTLVHEPNFQAFKQTRNLAVQVAELCQRGIDTIDPEATSDLPKDDSGPSETDCIG